MHNTIFLPFFFLVAVVVLGGNKLFLLLTPDCKVPKIPNQQDQF